MGQRTDPQRPPAGDRSGCGRAVQELSVLNELARGHQRVLGLRTHHADHHQPLGQGGQSGSRPRSTWSMPARWVSAGTVVRQADAEAEHFHLNQNLLGMMFHERRAILINDPVGDARLKGVRLDPGIRNLVCVPLLVGVAGNRRPQRLQQAAGRRLRQGGPAPAGHHRRPVGPGTGTLAAAGAGEGRRAAARRLAHGRAHPARPAAAGNSRRSTATTSPVPASRPCRWAATTTTSSP